MLGLRSVWKEGILATPAEMVFGTTLRIPGQFFAQCQEDAKDTKFSKQFKQMMNKLRPTNATNHSKESAFVHPHLHTCTHVFIRVDAVRPPLKPPYDGTYEVVRKNEKYFTVKINTKEQTISIDRVKPAFMPTDATNNDGNYQSTTSTEKKSAGTQRTQTKSKQKRNQQTVRKRRQPHKKTSNKAHRGLIGDNHDQAKKGYTTRYGRQVKEPNRMASAILAGE